MPRFVILRHQLPAESERPSHFDLMLEDDGSLLTWAMPDLPSIEPQLAEELPAHRLAYLEYEGPVSNNRGEVKQVAAGTFAWIVREVDRWEADTDDGQRRGRLILQRDEAGWLVWFR